MIVLQRGDTCTILAAKRGHLEIVRFLVVKARANIVKKEYQVRLYIQEWVGKKRAKM